MTTTIRTEQTNLIAKLLAFGTANGISTEVVRKMDVFPAHRKSAYTTHERQTLIQLLSSAQTFHGGHHYRDSDDDYERDLWAMRNAELIASLAQLKADNKAKGLLDTLIDAECWLSEAHKHSSADTELSKAIASLSQRIHMEIARYYSKMN
jgi:hypothetical protein